jgi:hypothetical protein
MVRALLSHELQKDASYIYTTRVLHFLPPRKRNKRAYAVLKQLLQKRE